MSLIKEIILSDIDFSNNDKSNMDIHFVLFGDGHKYT